MQTFYIAKKSFLKFNEAAILLTSCPAREIFKLIPENSFDYKNIKNFFDELDGSIVCVELHAFKNFWNSRIKFTSICTFDNSVVSCCFYFEKKFIDQINKIMDKCLKFSEEVGIRNSVESDIRNFNAYKIISLIQYQYSPMNFKNVELSFQ